MKLGIRQGIASAAVFGAVLMMLVSVDDREAILSTFLAWSEERLYQRGRPW